MGFRSRRLLSGAMNYKTTNACVRRRCWPVVARLTCSRKFVSLVLLPFLMAAIPLASRTKEKLSYGEGLIVNIPVPEAEVVQVVQEVVQNGVIRGTKEYNKDQFVGGAIAADSSNVFPAGDQKGKVFYKVRMHAIDPRNFKDSGDVGTLVVRYVIQPQGEKNTVLRIDALFEEDFRHTVHQSDGSVESAEYKDIREHLDQIELMQRQNLEAEQERQELLAKKKNGAIQSNAVPAARPPEPVPPVPQAMQSTADTAAPAAATTSPEPAPVPSPTAQTSTQSLEQHVKDLRRQVERLVKEPGAPLKSAPFHTAGTLQLLTPGTEVLILISTPYWYGVETHDGQHGWMLRDQLELTP